MIYHYWIIIIASALIISFILVCHTDICAFCCSCTFIQFCALSAVFFLLLINLIHFPAYLFQVGDSSNIKTMIKTILKKNRRCTWTGGKRKQKRQVQVLEGAKETNFLATPFNYSSKYGQQLVRHNTSRYKILAQSSHFQVIVY